MNQPYSNTVFRLTALWALCESGLGGWMHALHLPFTGFFVGAFAVVIISLIAHFTGGNFRQVVQATALVLLLKAAVSPQSPLPAYIAVAFQGIMGALLFSLFRFRLACILLGIITMMENALQKVLVATIIFGNSLWKALNMFFSGIAKELRLPSTVSFSFWLIGIYVLVYAVWGLVLGLWMARLPQLLAAKADSVLKEVNLTHAGMEAASVKGRRTIRLFTGMLLLLFIVVVLWFGANSLGKIYYIVLRTICVVALLVFVIGPVFRWSMQRLVKKQERQKQFMALIDYLPELRSYVRPAYELARKEPALLARFRSFVLTLIILTLYRKDEQQ